MLYIWRHRKERLSKCSLRGLEERFNFYKYPDEPLPAPPDARVLSVDGPPLTAEDADHPLILVDATWRYAERMAAQLPQMRRSLPRLETAYPRRQDEEAGLASIEALYAACLILGWPVEGLLDNYRWGDDFLEKNREALDNACRRSQPGNP